MLVDNSDDKTQKQRAQISDFIANLKGRTEALDGWAKHAQQGLTGDSFTTYLEFRDLVIECESFNEVIQRRIEKAEQEGAHDDLQEQLDTLTARQLTLAMQASLKFLKYIADKNLPLGSRDVFIKELNDLYRMKKNLDKERIQEKVDPAALEDQRKVEEILATVIEKAPQLFSFDNLDEEEEDENLFDTFTKKRR